MSKRILLATVGTLGDLHPFLAIGLALKARGASVLLAVPETHVAKARAAGLNAEPVLPDFHEMGRDTGLDSEQFTRKVMRDPGFLAKKVLLPYFARSYAALDKLADGVDLIAGSTLFMAAYSLAEKRGIPFVPMMLQPLTLMSAYDPPYLREYPVLVPGPNGPAARAWNRAAIVILNIEIARRYSGMLNRARRKVGLGAYRGLPLLGVPPGSPLTIGMYSPAIAPPQPDYPPETSLVGFPLFDSETGRPEGLAPDLQAFLDAGEPPIVFTLGSFAIYAAGDFYARSREAARALGRRAVLLTGHDDTRLAAPDCFVARYAPHSALFPHAAAVVHHGGIGTTGQVLRAGKPHLIVPHLGDQHDNAARIRRLGLGRAIKPGRYTAKRAAAALSALLDDPGLPVRAKAVADQIAAERPADHAADLLMAALDRLPARH